MRAKGKRRHLRPQTTSRALRQVQRDITPRATTVAPSGSQLRFLQWLPAQQIGLQTVDEQRDHETDDAGPDRIGVCRHGRTAETRDVDLAAYARNANDDLRTDDSNQR